MKTDEKYDEVIYAYTRKEALADGWQVKLTGDLASLPREAGWKYPVYLTSGVWGLIERAVESKTHCNDINGVLWDIVYMARFGREISQNTRIFTVIITGTGKKRNYQLMMQVGPTDIDDPNPALTIMLPEER